MKLQRHYFKIPFNFVGEQLIIPPAQYFQAHTQLIKPLAYFVDAPSSFDSALVIIDQKPQIQTVITVSHSLIYATKNIQLPDQFDPIQALSLIHPRDSYINLLRKKSESHGCKKQQNSAVRTLTVNGELIQHFQTASIFCQQMFKQHKVQVYGDFNFLFTENTYTYNDHVVTIEREQKLNRVILIRTDGIQAKLDLINEKAIDGTLFVINVNFVDDLVQFFVYFNGVSEKYAYPFCEEKHFHGVKLDENAINWLKIKIINCDLLYQKNEFAIDNVAAVVSNSMEMQFIGSYKEVK